MQSNRAIFITSSLICWYGAWLAPASVLAAEPAAVQSSAVKPAARTKTAARMAPKAAAAPVAPKAAAPAAADSKAAVPADSKAGAPADTKAAGPGAAPSAPVAAAPLDAPAAGQGSQSPEVLLEAKQRFDRGFELYNEGEYPLALIEFNRAYELVPNYRVLYNIGQVCIQLAQYANARRALEEYRTKGGDELPAERREAVARDLAMLDRRTAFLMITTNVPGAEVLVDDVVVGKTPLGPALLVDAGVHRISARLQGYQQRASRVTLAGGDEQTLALTLDIQPEVKPTIVLRDRVDGGAQTLMIAGWVTTGALAAGAVITGILGSSEAKELDKLKEEPPTDDLAERLDSSKSKAASLFLASDVLSGAAVVVGGLSLWITLDPPKPKAPADSPVEPGAPPRDLQVGYQDGQFQLRGSF
jgi:tetratricopeptide (TPR) repeat protein